MSDQKTKPTPVSVEDFLAALPDERKRADSIQICKMMTEITGEPPVIWGPSIVGFGSYHYVYASGHSGDAPLTGFSPRKANLTIYIMGGFDQYESLLSRLGKHSVGKSCLYIKRLDDVDRDVLRDLIDRSYRYMHAQHPRVNAPA
jgi:hypothetical protein